MECMARLRIRQLRKAAKLSHVELAEAAGIHQTTISRIESGKQTALEDGVADALARALGCPVGDLWEAEADAHEPSTTHDAQPIPSMSSRPGWEDVLARAKASADDVDPESWIVLEHAPGLFASDVPLTPALVADLARVVMRHRPPKR